MNETFLLTINASILWGVVSWRARTVERIEEVPQELIDQIAALSISMKWP